MRPPRPPRGRVKNISRDGRKFGILLGVGKEFFMARAVPRQVDFDLG